MSEDRLNTIRALLAKAERTTFPEEAKAFATKAEELMVKWAIDEALIRGAKDDGTIGKTTIRLPANEYRAPKMHLIGSIARLHDCRIIRDRQFHVCATCGGHGYGTSKDFRHARRWVDGQPVRPECPSTRGERVFEVEIIGFKRDRDFVEVLFTSLLIQAENEYRSPEVQERQAQEAPQGGHRIAWRNAFMQGYAGTIWRRLKEAKDRRIQQAESDGAPGVSIVLADRSKLVDARFKEMYPSTRPVKSSAGRSWGSGRAMGAAAGERADVGNPRVSPGSRPAVGGGR